jgi:hypothetical protein
MLLEETEWTCLIRFNARKLLTALYEMGYSNYNAEMLVKSLGSVNSKLAQIDQMWNKVADFEVVELFDNIIKGENDES